jgi:hypothetical protein
MKPRRNLVKREKKAASGVTGGGFDSREVVRKNALTSI